MGRGMNPHKMKRMMKQMGINIEEFDDVEEIIIRTSDKEYIFDHDVAVTLMVAQGQKTFQIVGDPTIYERSGKSKTDSKLEDSSDEEEDTASIPQEDVDLVCSQTGASEEDARAALEACGGNPAEAILKLMDN
jgi:nascent polypeptide-associated complex subunit alpha